MSHGDLIDWAFKGAIALVGVFAMYWAKKTDHRLESLEKNESALGERLATIEGKLDTLISLHLKKKE